MKKKILMVLLTLIMAAGVLGMFACGKSGVDFTLDGKKVPASVTAELGDLYILPKVVATAGGEEVNLEVKVTDIGGNEIELVNKKFKATNLGGYNITFTATELEKSVTIKLNVKDSTAPQFSIKGTSGSVALLNSEVYIPDCTVIDASSDSLTATYTVKDKNGASVTVTDGKFLANLIGNYTITYTSTDGSGNTGNKDFIISCKNAVMLNDFETVDDIGWIQFEKEISAVTENAETGNGIKIQLASQISNPATGYRRICVPFKKADGSFYTWEEIQKFEGIQIYAYFSTANELGLTNFTSAVEQGKNTIYFSSEQIKSAYLADSAQYSNNENGFYLNLKYATANSYIVFDNCIGIYPEDYVEDIKFTLNDGSALPESFTVDMNKDFILPQLKAMRGETEATITATVKDSNSAIVTVTENKFVAVDLGGYTITYTATDSHGTETITVSVSVTDTRIPKITVDGVSGGYVLKGSVVTIPGSTVTIETGETLTATVEVTSPEGTAVTISQGAFTADKSGIYTLTYSATSENGLTGTAEFTFICKYGELLNDFTSASNVGYMAFENSKEVTGGGLKVTVTSTSEINWARVCIPMKNANGFISLEELLEFDHVEFYVDISKANEIGLATFVNPVDAGKTVLVFTKAQIQAALSSAPEQYSANENGFYLNFKYARPGDYIVYYGCLGVYADDYVPPVKFNLENGTSLPQKLEVDMDNLFTLPQVEAFRKGTAANVTVKVLDSQENEVQLSDNAFIASDLGGYVIIYTATDAQGSSNAEIILEVNDTRVPQITVDGAIPQSVYEGAEITVPTATATYLGEAVNVTISVMKAENEITLTEGKFIASPGEYTITYTAQSGDKTETKIFTIVCKQGVLLNGFASVSDIGWIQFENSKEVVAATQTTPAGLKITYTAADASNWRRICVPFKKADGSFYTWEEVLAFDKIEFTLYSSADNELGLVNGVLPVTIGKNVLTFTKAELIAAFAADPAQYSNNENGFFINLKFGRTNEYFIFESFVGITEVQ